MQLTLRILPPLLAPIPKSSRNTRESMCALNPSVYQLSLTSFFINCEPLKGKYCSSSVYIIQLNYFSTGFVSLWIQMALLNILLLSPPTKIVSIWKKKSAIVSLETLLCSSCLLGLRDKTANLLEQREKREGRDKKNNRHFKTCSVWASQERGGYSMLSKV